MGFHSIDFAIAVFLALASFVYIGWTHRCNTTDEYHSAARSAGPWRTIATLFTVVGAPHFAVFTTLAYFYGWLSLAFWAGTLTGFYILSFISKKIRGHINRDAHSFADIAASELGRGPAFIMTICSVLFTVGVVVAQFIIGSKLLGAVTGLDYSYGVVLLVFTSVAYLYFGGYKALISTDVLQGFIMLAFTAVLAGFLIYNVKGGLPNVFYVESYVRAPIVPFIPLLFMAGVLVVMGAPEIWQRILSARDDGIARKSLRKAGFTMTVWGFLVVSMGISISIISPDSVPAEAFIHYVTAELPGWLLGVLGVLIIAAILSTVDTEIFASSIFAYKEIQRFRLQSGDLEIRYTQWLIVMFGLISLFGALLLSDLLAAWSVLLNMAYVTAPLALCIVLGRGGSNAKIKRISFYVSFTASSLAFVYIALTSNDYFSWHSLIVVVSASLPLLIPGARISNVGNLP